jgi:hypothetical protein
VTEYIELAVPASPEHLSLVRLTTGSVAARLDLTLDELEDLQLAVDELCLILLGRVPGDGLHLVVRLEWSTADVEVRCSIPATPREPGGALDDPSPGTTEALSRQLLEALVDEHGVAQGATSITAWLKKRRLPSRPPR